MASPHYGKGLKLPVNGKFEPQEGIDKVLEDIQALLLTDFGERVMRPEYGCGLTSRLWENLDEAADIGTSDIIEAINRYEPRVTLIEVVPTIDRALGAIFFKIRMIILETNTEANLVFPFKPASQISNR